MNTIKHLKPSPKRAINKRQSAHALFGSTDTFPISYLAGNGNFPDQNADNRPNECTGYSEKDGILSVQSIEISHDFQFLKTLEAEGDTSDGEVSMDTAFNIPPSVGVILATQEPVGMSAMSESEMINPENWPTSLDGETTKIPPSIPVVPASGQDWYDAIKNALLAGKAWNGIVAVGTQWSPDFENVGADGILTDTPTNLYWGHCHNYCGWEVNADGIERLNDKTWQGTSYGKEGWDFASRTLVNLLMSAYGAEARLFTNQSQLIQQKIDILIILIDFIQDILYGIGNAVHNIIYKSSPK